MAHPLDHQVASDLSNLVLQKRRREGQVPAPVLDGTDERLKFNAVAASRESVPDSFQGEPAVIPTWHFHGRKGQR